MVLTGIQANNRDISIFVGGHDRFGGPGDIAILSSSGNTLPPVELVVLEFGDLRLIAVQQNELSAFQELAFVTVAELQHIKAPGIGPGGAVRGAVVLFAVGNVAGVGVARTADHSIGIQSGGIANINTYRAG